MPDDRSRQGNARAHRLSDPAVLATVGLRRQNSVCTEGGGRQVPAAFTPPPHPRGAPRNSWVAEGQLSGTSHVSPRSGPSPHSSGGSGPTPPLSPDGEVHDQPRNAALQSFSSADSREAPAVLPLRESVRGAPATVPDAAGFARRASPTQRAGPAGGGPQPDRAGGGPGWSTQLHPQHHPTQPLLPQLGQSRNSQSSRVSGDPVARQSIKSNTTNSQRRSQALSDEDHPGSLARLSNVSSPHSGRSPAAGTANFPRSQSSAPEDDLVLPPSAQFTPAGAAGGGSPGASRIRPTSPLKRALMGRATVSASQKTPPRHSPPPVKLDGSPGEQRIQRRLSPPGKNAVVKSPLDPSVRREEGTRKPPQSEPKKVLRWKKGKFIGAGAFGYVCLGLNQDTGELMAVKSIQFNAADKDIARRLQALQHEIRVMRQLVHKNVVRYLCTERVGSQINIFMEFVPGGSIATLLREFGPLSEETIRSYTRQILEALAFLHSENVVHRDIKAANVLVNVSGTCKLADFGTAVFVRDLAAATEAAQEMSGTPCWMAPEVVTNQRCGPPCDIWSLGCTVIEMLCARAPFWWVTPNPLKLLNWLGGNSPVVLPSAAELHSECEVGMGTYCRDFLTACLKRDPGERPEAAALLGDGSENNSGHIFIDLDEDLDEAEDDDDLDNPDNVLGITAGDMNAEEAGFFGGTVPVMLRSGSGKAPTRSSHSTRSSSHTSPGAMSPQQERAMSREGQLGLDPDAGGEHPALQLTAGRRSVASSGDSDLWHRPRQSSTTNPPLSPPRTDSVRGLGIAHAESIHDRLDRGSSSITQGFNLTRHTTGDVRANDGHVDPGSRSPDHGEEMIPTTKSIFTQPGPGWARKKRERGSKGRPIPGLVREGSQTSLQTVTTLQSRPQSVIAGSPRTLHSHPSITTVGNDERDRITRHLVTSCLSLVQLPVDGLTDADGGNLSPNHSVGPEALSLAGVYGRSGHGHRVHASRRSSVDAPVARVPGTAAESSPARPFGAHSPHGSFGPQGTMMSGFSLGRFDSPFEAPLGSDAATVITVNPDLLCARMARKLDADASTAAVVARLDLEEDEVASDGGSSRGSPGPLVKGGASKGCPAAIKRLLRKRWRNLLIAALSVAIGVLIILLLLV